MLVQYFVDTLRTLMTSRCFKCSRMVQIAIYWQFLNLLSNDDGYYIFMTLILVQQSQSPPKLIPVRQKQYFCLLNALTAYYYDMYGNAYPMCPCPNFQENDVYVLLRTQMEASLEDNALNQNFIQKKTDRKSTKATSQRN